MTRPELSVIYLILLSSSASLLSLPHNSKVNFILLVYIPLTSRCIGVYATHSYAWNTLLTQWITSHQHTHAVDTANKQWLIMTPSNVLPKCQWSLLLNAKLYMCIYPSSSQINNNCIKHQHGCICIIYLWWTNGTVLMVSWFCPSPPAFSPSRPQTLAHSTSSSPPSSSHMLDISPSHPSWSRHIAI